MSFKIKIDVGGKVYEKVIACEYTLTRQTDVTGRPSTDVRGGKISATVSVDKGETELFEWISDPHATKEGSIVFIKRDSDATLKELKFKDAHMVGYQESFNANDDNPLRITFELSANEISLGNGEHKNNWHK